MLVNNYRELRVWQEGMFLVEKVYRLTRTLPKEEVYGLTSQVRRAAVSIPANIAEGFRRFGAKEYIKFLRISQGSLSELETEVLIAGRLNYFSNVIVQDILTDTERLTKMISAMISKLSQKINIDHAPRTTDYAQ